MAEVRSTFFLKPGDDAPDFLLPDGSGNLVSLSDTAGERGLLVVFACNHCPFVVHLADAIRLFSKAAAARGVGVVAISSNDVDNYPQDAPEEMLRFADEHGWEFPYLYDESQQVARAYAAACTPDFFLFDADLQLHYAGQFDASRPKKQGIPVTGEDLRHALDDMLAGRSAVLDAVPSSGCNIKWKPGNEPPYFG